jgi:hypothetical protein
LARRACGPWFRANSNFSEEWCAVDAHPTAKERRDAPDPGRALLLSFGEQRRRKQIRGSERNGTHAPSRGEGRARPGVNPGETVNG